MEEKKVLADFNYLSNNVKNQFLQIHVYYINGEHSDRKQHISFCLRKSFGTEWCNELC